MKFINSLTQTDLEKLIRVIKLIVERNKTSQQSVQTQNLTGTTPVTYSNSPTTQTPHYNPQTGQYQSKPATNGNNSSFGSPGEQQNPYANNLPFTGQTQSTQNQPSTPLGALLKGINQGIQVDTVDLSKLDVPEFCKQAPNYGAKPAGKCFDVLNTTSHVKETLAYACAAIGKPVPVVSASRNGVNCNNAGVSSSEHLSGRAVDIGFTSLESKDRQKVFEVFKKRGFNAYGCYGPNSADGVHLDHGTERRWGPCKKATCWHPNHCPQELFLGGYSR